MPKVKIGVFDSGVGGLSVVNAIKKELPDIEVVFKNDAQHVPYATRTIEEIYGFAKPVIGELVNDGCVLIVIACNTVSTNLIERLRDDFAVPLIAMEPMVKPAAEITKSKTIAVCATPRTLSSKRYARLKQEFANNIKVLEPDCSDWSYLIEHNQLDRKKIRETVEAVIAKGADVIVLGCTHYHWIEEDMKQVAIGRAVVLQPEKPVIDQLKRVLAQRS